MKKTVAIRQNHEFRSLYYKGGSKASGLLVLYFKKNRYGQSRLGITVSKKIGKANVRNRAKRRLREVLRLNAPYMKSGFDFVVVARSRTPEIEFSKLAGDLSVALKKVGAFSDE